MKQGILIVAACGLLAGCGEADAPEAAATADEGAAQAPDAVDATDASTGGDELFYEYTLIPGSEYLHGIGPDLQGGKGSRATYAVAMGPSEVNDIYEQQSRDQGFIIEGRSMLGEDDWLTVHDADGRLILQSVAEPTANGSSYSLGFKLYPDE